MTKAPPGAFLMVVLMRYGLVLVLALLASTACSDSARLKNEPARADAEPVQALQAIVQRDAEEDARQAFDDGDRRFWAYNTRQARVVPGVDADRYPDWPTRTAPGMGDVVYGSEHRVIRQRFVDYAAAYNQTLLRLQADKNR